MNICNFVDILDFYLHLDLYLLITSQSYERCRGLYISSSFRPIIRPSISPPVRPFVNFTSRYVINPFDCSYLSNTNSDSYHIYLMISL